MDAKESLIKIIKALLEIGQPVTRQILADYLMGKESREIAELGLDDNETYGIGDAHDEDYWTIVIDKAFESGYLKAKSAKSDNLTVSKEGKKFAKKPTPFMIDEEEEATDENLSGLNDLEDLMADLPNADPNSPEQKASAKTKQQLILYFCSWNINGPFYGILHHIFCCVKHSLWRFVRVENLLPSPFFCLNQTHLFKLPRCP